MSIHTEILRACMVDPFRVAVIDDRRKYKSIELVVGALHMATQIEKHCKAPHVGIMLPTSGAFPIAALGAWLAGKVIVPLNYLLEKEQLQYIVDDAGLDTIIAADALLEHIGYEPEVESIVRMDKLSFKGFPKLRWPKKAADDLAMLLYTSGTSGKPKGVMLSHGNIVTNVRQCIEHAGLHHGQTMLGVLPQFHTFGMTALTLLPLIKRLTVIYSARFVPQKIVKLFREHKPYFFVGIPSMYNALLRVKDAKPSDFAETVFLVSGGEPLPDAVAANFRERFDKTISEGFGMTESSPVTNLCRPQEHKPHSVGPALPRIHQRIVDVETGEDLPPNQDGELRTAGPNIMKGYYKLPDETAAAFDEKGYLRTGDMARIDDDGHLFITGRIKEMIIVGGENVFPREIEEVLIRHPAVHDAGVVGCPCEIRGEFPVAFVELAEGHEGTEQNELRQFCRENLA
ncbi:MAG: AMP-binding protein, partial [Planctomycetota bacterium]